MYKEEVQRGTLVCGILQPLKVLLASLKPAGRAEFRSSPWFSFRDVMMRHFYIHRCDIVQNCMSWFEATSDLYHKHAIRSLALQVVVQLTKVVESFRGKGQATDFMSTQLDAIQAVIPMTNEVEADDNKDGTASAAPSVAPSNVGGGQKEPNHESLEPLGHKPPEGPLGHRGIQWETKQFTSLFAEVSLECTTRLETRRRRLEAQRRRLEQRKRAARLAEELRVAQLQAAAETKALAAKAKATKIDAARFMTHIGSFEACDDAMTLLTNPLTTMKSLKQFFSRHTAQVAALERQVAAVTHCGPRYDEFVRSVAAAVEVSLAKQPTCDADACAIALAASESDEVLAATVMAWAASRDATNLRKKGERRLQAAAAHVQRIAILKALVAAQRNREQHTIKEKKKQICDLEVGDVAWEVPRPLGETASAFDILARGSAQSLADRANVCRILDVQCISEGKRSFEVGPNPHWVSDCEITLIDVSQLNTAARIVHPVLCVEAHRVLNERLSFLLSASGSDQRASACSKSCSRGGSRQGRLVPNPRAESRGGPKGSPEFILVGVGRGGTHTTTSSAASDAFAALGAAFASTPEANAHSAAATPLLQNPLNDEMAAQEARRLWQARKEKQMAAKQKVKVQRRLLKKIRPVRGEHAVDVHSAP
eukprot:INCI1268.1.p1 GENE.INCI1268.1~~INCI1268.1.p1  ORF type:complete len:654 (-),score=124.37 INCI1268.1:182-2143(-)